MLINLNIRNKNFGLHHFKFTWSYALISYFDIKSKPEYTKKPEAVSEDLTIYSSNLMMTLDKEFW